MHAALPAEVATIRLELEVVAVDDKLDVFVVAVRVLVVAMVSLVVSVLVVVAVAVVVEAASAQHRTDELPTSVGVHCELLPCTIRRGSLGITICQFCASVSDWLSPLPRPSVLRLRRSELQLSATQMCSESILQPVPCTTPCRTS